MSFYDELIEKSEEEYDRLQKNPELWEKEYEDVSDEFLPPEVGHLVSEFKAGHFNYQNFIQLSTEKRQQFLDYVSENFPITLDIQEKTA